MRLQRFTAWCAMAVLAGLLAACGEQAPDGAGGSAEAEKAPSADNQGRRDEPEVSVKFKSPADGAMVTSPFKVEMAAEGVDIVPAGTMEEGTGHMHILIDEPFVLPGNVIPSDETHRHYGDGSTSTTLDLAPGEYVLRLQLADGAHKAFQGSEYRDVITVEVLEAADDTLPSEETGPTEDDAGGS